MDVLFVVIFLGQPREDWLVHVHDVGRWERAGMLWLVAGCVALGLLPQWFIQAIDPVTRQLVSHDLGETVSERRWLLVPAGAERASYGPVIFLLGVAASFALAWLLVRRLCQGQRKIARRAVPAQPWPGATPGAARALKARAGRGRVD